MSTLTTNYDLIKPSPNDPTDQDVWGGYLNTDLDMIDTLLKSATFTTTAALSGNTVLDTTYINKVVLVDATSGNLTITLPAAATAGAGFNLAVVKTDSSSNTVTVDADGSETINGAANQVITTQYGQLELVCNGTTWYAGVSKTLNELLPSQTGNSGKFLTTDGTNTSWGTVTSPLFTEEFVSADQTITAGGTLTIPHGLAGIPKFCVCFIKCTSTDAGYAVDDIVQVNAHYNGTSASQGQSLICDATNINIQFGSLGQTYGILSKGSGSGVAITNSKWKLIVKAYY